MNPTQRLLFEIAKLAIDALGSEVSPPPPATEPAKPTRRVKRKKLRKAVRKPAPATTPFAKRRGRPPGAKDYICPDCKHAFRAVNPDRCPMCESTNYVTKKDYDPDTL